MKTKQRITKNVTVAVTSFNPKKRGYFYISSDKASLTLGLKEARTAFAVLRDFFIPPERRKHAKLT